MKKLKLIAFVIGLLLANVAGFAQVPQFDWIKRHDTISDTDSLIQYEARDIVVDAAGNTYVVGSIFWGQAIATGIPSGVYVAKYNTVGDEVWLRESWDEDFMDAGGSSIDLDKENNVYITATVTLGIFDILTDGYDGIVLIKFDSNGNLLWGRSASTPFNDSAAYPLASGIDSTGNFYVSGIFYRSVSFEGDTSILTSGHEGDNFLVKYDTEGNFLWVKNTGQKGNYSLYTGQLGDWTSNVLSVDAAGNAYLAGYFSDTIFTLAGATPLYSAGGVIDMFWAKYSPQGNLLWNKRAGTAGSIDIINAIDVRGNHLYISGRVQNPATIGGINFSGGKFLGRFDKEQGNASWIKPAGGGGVLETDIEGSVYAAGNYHAPSTFANNTVGSGYLLAKYDSAGNGIWGKYFLKGSPIAVGIPDNIYTTIYTESSMNLDGIPLPTKGNYLAKLGISNSIKGTIRRMASANCTDTTGAGLPYFVVKTPQGYHTLTNEQGKYRLSVPRGAGNYTVQSAVPQELSGIASQVCPANGSHTANFPFSEQPQVIAEKNFGYNIIDCHKLIVNISSNRRRYCEENTTVVSYRNVGVSTAANAYVLVKFPEHVTPQSSTLAWSSFDAATRTYRFELGNIAGNSNGSFTITDKTACDNIQLLGLSQCTEATIFPASSCPAPSNWNGTSAGVYGKCLGNGVVRLGIYNETAAAMSDSVSYRVYLDSLLVGTKKVKLAASDTAKMQVLAFGKTVRLEVEQVANHPTEQSVSVTVEGCSDSNGAVSQGFVNKFSQPNTASSKTQCLEIRGSYDPNDKQVFPRGFTAQHIVAPNTKLEYLIRFQNMGTDTAFAVVVVDTLSEHFDIESLEIGAASHPFKLEMQTRFGRTYLRWEFPNIVLPHKAVNDLKSQGFVQFRIKPLANKPLGTQVHNKAGIYFDYNPAIITNETLTTFDNITFSNPNLGNVITSNAKAVNQSWHLYPNPSKGGVFSAEIATNSEVSVTDVLGRELYSSKLSTGKHEIRLQEVGSGVYFVRVSNAQGVSVKKLVIE